MNKFKRNDIINAIYDKNQDFIIANRFNTDMYVLKLLDSLDDAESLAIAKDNSFLFELDGDALSQAKRTIANNRDYSERMTSMSMDAVGKVFQNFVAGRDSGSSHLSNGLMDTQIAKFEELTQAGTSDGRLMAALYATDKKTFKKLYDGIVTYVKTGTVSKK